MGFGALGYVAFPAGLWVSLPIGMAAEFASVHGQGAVLGASGVGVAVAFSTGAAASNRVHVSCMRVVVTTNLRRVDPQITIYDIPAPAGPWILDKHAAAQLVCYSIISE